MLCSDNLLLVFLSLSLAATAFAEPPAELQPWLSATQNWVRDTDGPVVSLGAAGAFDDTHIFAPSVVKHPHGDGYQLWYCGSTNTVAKRVSLLGLATSADGRTFRKHETPVFSFPLGRRSVLTPSVLRDTAGSPIREDGKLRMWYASRKAPPHVNKYFALNTAIWRKPPGKLEPISSYPKGEAEFADWQTGTREKLRQLLGIPAERVALNPEKRGELQHDGIVIEKWVFTSEPGSRVPALLYRPERPKAEMPAIVLTYGHGGSKSAWQYHYAGQLYAKLGLACLAIDPIGEEERHAEGDMGTRAHDKSHAHQAGLEANRLIMGKLVFDTMRGIDFLEERNDMIQHGEIDAERIGVAGNSLGGAVAGWMAVLEPRLKLAIVSGWTFADIALRTKNCTKVPNQRMRELCSWQDYIMLAKPCSLLIMNGDADWVIDREDDGSAWAQLRSVVDCLHPDYATVDVWFEAGGGHRPYFVYQEGLLRIQGTLGTPNASFEKIQSLPSLNSGTFCDANGIQLERLYGTDLHQRGATLPDLGIRLLTPEQLAVLKPGEAGRPEFTLAGWLETLEATEK